MINPEKLNNGYEFFTTIDGYWLTLPTGETKFFLFYSDLKKYCEANGITLES